MGIPYLRSSINCLIIKRDELIEYLGMSEVKICNMAKNLEMEKELIKAYNVELREVEETITFLGEQEAK